jgi:hypothetical protein
VGKIDLSQIECRLLNTVAGQWDVVEKFRNGIDLYSELATQFYGFLVDKTKPAERGTGKQLELSCGYGAGGPTIVRTARAGTYGPPVHLSDEQGIAARDLYRGTHQQVVQSWKYANDVILPTLASGGTLDWGCMTVHDHRIFGPGPIGDRLWLDYSSLEYTTFDDGKPGWRHQTRTGWRKTYGAKMHQNICEFLGRLVISQAMGRIRDLGLRVVLSAHDDVYILIPRDGLRSSFLVQMWHEITGQENDHVTAQQILQICAHEMARPLSWLPGCPIQAEAELLDALSGEPIYKLVA